MARELLILRHAKSAWDTDAPSDYERPLSKRGRKAAPRVGRYLNQQGLIPDFVISSPATRARQTVIAVCEEMDIDSDRITWDERVYGAWTSTLFEVLRQSPEQARRVMIAGHNPGLEMLLLELCDEQLRIANDGKLMPTAAVAQLEINSSWSDLNRGSGRLLSLTRARSLTE
jgi:phosphohistidine phosphatase